MLGLTLASLLFTGLEAGRVRKEDKPRQSPSTAGTAPHNTVCFVPATPNSELANKIQEFVDKEMKNINMSAKIVETAGISIRDQTVKLDLTGCVFPDCWPCESGEKGGSHTKRGPVYSGVCLDCGEVNITAGYDGESGFSAYNRFKRHKTSIKNKTTSNAFARHLNDFHPEKVKDYTGFKVKIERTFKKCLDRQVKRKHQHTSSYFHFHPFQSCQNIHNLSSCLFVFDKDTQLCKSNFFLNHDPNIYFEKIYSQK